MRPDSVEVRHILLKSENYPSDSAKIILEDYKNQVKSGIIWRTYFELF